jgi:hypothetical protein
VFNYVMRSVCLSVTLFVSENNCGCECVEMQGVTVGRRLGKLVILPPRALTGVEMNLFSHFIFHKGSTGALIQYLLLWPLIYRLATCSYGNLFYFNARYGDVTMRERTVMLS